MVRLHDAKVYIGRCYWCVMSRINRISENTANVKVDGKELVGCIRDEIVGVVRDVLHEYEVLDVQFKAGKLTAIVNGKVEYQDVWQDFDDVEYDEDKDITKVSELSIAFVDDVLTIREFVGENRVQVSPASVINMARLDILGYTGMEVKKNVDGNWYIEAHF